MRNENLRVPGEPGPVFGHIDVIHIRRLFYALFGVRPNIIYAHSTYALFDAYSAYIRPYLPIRYALSQLKFKANDDEPNESNVGKNGDAHVAH